MAERKWIVIGTLSIGIIAAATSLRRSMRRRSSTAMLTANQDEFAGLDPDENTETANLFGPSDTWTTMTVSKRDFDLIEAAIANPRPPTPAMTALFKRYRERNRMPE